MRKNLNTLFKYSTLAIVIVFGFITIIGTGGDDDKSGHTSNIEGEWDLTYGYDDLPGISTQEFVFTQDGKDVTFTGKFATPPDEEVTIYECTGEGTINGSELTITDCRNDDVGLTVIFYKGIIVDQDTRIIGTIDKGGISWEAYWENGKEALGSSWIAQKCGS